MAAPTADQTRVPSDPEEIVEAVKSRYGAIAASASPGCCTPDPACCVAAEAAASRIGYASDDLDLLPEGANLGLGCGAPIAHLELAPGETVLDLGAGAGIDALLASRKVGPTGLVIGVDMTPEMVARARANATADSASNVEIREGRLEKLPVGDSSIDAVTSNCVINLVPDKAAVFREVARVLRPGGRLVVSDVVLEGPLPEAISSDLLSYVGCVAGALQRDHYFRLVEEAGLRDLEILQDVDFLAALGDALPDELAELAMASGVNPAELAGKVRSMTYRAWKR